MNFELYTYFKRWPTVNLLSANFYTLRSSNPRIREKPLQKETRPGPSQVTFRNVAGSKQAKLELQTTFFAATAHKLRTLLTVLKTLAPTLSPLPHLPSQTQTEINDTFAQNLELLVTDMLESARLKAGTVALHPRSLDLTGYCEATYQAAPVSQK
ncbi:MAG: hypothetical protein Fur0044_41170 [Anaerolineae bacterium]